MSGYLKIPIISGGGGGAVDSVNGQTGVVVLTKADINLGNVNNTSDANKPVSTATQTALNLKADTSALTSHTSNTSNPHSTTKAQIGLSNADNTSDVNKPVSTAAQTALNLKEDKSNKAINFSLQNNTLYPSVKAANDQIVASLSSANSYYFTNTVSDQGGGRYEMTKDIPAGGGFGTNYPAVNNGDYLLQFSTILDYPNVTSIPSGTFMFHIEGRQNSGTQVTRIYAELYSRTSPGGVNTLIATSDLSESLTGSNTTLVGSVTIPITRNLLATDRLTLAFRADVSGAGTTPDISLDIQGTTSSRMTVPFDVDLSVTYPLKAPTGILSDPPSYGFAGGDDDTGMWSNGDGNVSFSANGQLRLHVDQTETTVVGNLVVDTINGNAFPQTGPGNTFTVYDNAGVQSYLPNWNWNNDYQGLSNYLTYHPDGSGPKIHTFETEVNAAADQPGSSVTILALDSHVDRANTGFQTGSLVSIAQNLSFEGDGDINNVSAQSVNLSVGNGTYTATGNQVAGYDLNLSLGSGHTVANIAPFRAQGQLNGTITGGYEGLLINPQINGSANQFVGINNTADINGDVNFFSSMEMNPQFDDATILNLRGINISPLIGDVGPVTVDSYIGYNCNPQWHSNSTANNVVGFWDAQTFQPGTTITGSYNSVLTNPQLDGVNVTNTMYSLYNNPQFGATTSTTLNSHVGLGIYSNFQSNAHVVQDVYAIDSGIGFQSGSSIGNNYFDLNIHPNISTPIGGSYWGLNITPNLVSAQGMQGISFSPSTCTMANYAHGIQVNMNQVTLSANEFKQAISSTGGSLNAGFDVNNSVENLPPFVASVHNIGSNFTVAAGHPITNTGMGTPPFIFLTQLGGSFGFEDDVDPDFTGARLGVNIVGSLAQVAGASGKTVDMFSLNFAGASYPSLSTGGTITDANCYRALGIIPDGGGGTLNITNFAGFHADPVMSIVSATNAWAFKDSTNLENHFNKLAVNTGDKKAASGYNFNVSGNSLLQGDLLVNNGNEMLTVTGSGVILKDASGIEFTNSNNRNFRDDTLNVALSAQDRTLNNTASTTIADWSGPTEFKIFGDLSVSNLGAGVVTSNGAGLLSVGAISANQIGIVPSGNISATDVQGAIDELDSEKLSATNGILLGHIVSNQVATTTVTINANAGTGASASLANATDVAGKVAITSGALSLASGTQATISFGNSYSIAPIVIITPADANGAIAESVLGVYVTSTTSGFSINLNAALTLGSTYSWNYMVIETQ